MSYDISLTLIGKPGCHLCDDARLVVNTVAGQFRSLHAGVASSVPVLLLDGKVHNYWKIDPIRLMAALEEAIR